jgi:hypothetical protein
MQRLSVDQMIRKIEQGSCFEAVSEDYSFTLKIEDYVHYVCGAVHDGHQFRKELWENCTHSAFERWYEEDPATRLMVQSHPIVLAGLDSRFEYDLNREPGTAIYEDAWGKSLWKKPLDESMIRKSLEKHGNFYRVVHALIEKLEDIHQACVVYDMHSYNWKRWTREVPTWNLGTSNVDNARFGEVIESWRESLAEIRMPDEIPSTARINDTFYGNGYFLKYITGNFKNTLVLATEVAKVYCDELSVVLYPEVIRAIEEELKIRLPRHAEEFMELLCK